MKMLLETDEWYPVYHLRDYEEPTDWEKSEGYLRKVVEIDDKLHNRFDKALQEFKAVQEILYKLDEKTEWTKP